jgi:hypothetical protein
VLSPEQMYALAPARMAVHHGLAEVECDLLREQPARQDLKICLLNGNGHTCLPDRIVVEVCGVC